MSSALLFKEVLDSIDKNGGIPGAAGITAPAARWQSSVTSVPAEKSLRQVISAVYRRAMAPQHFNATPAITKKLPSIPRAEPSCVSPSGPTSNPQLRLPSVDMMIEYGPVEIGGKTYICPLRSISIVRGRSVRILSEWDEFFRTYGPYATMLNDITFDRYHIFRSESHVLPDFIPSEN